MEEKFMENREKMFMPEIGDDDKDLFFLKTDRIKLRKDKDNNNSFSDNNNHKDVKLKIDIAKEINNENIEQNIEMEKAKDINNSPLRFASINIQDQHPYKSILKKTTNINQSPTNVKVFNENDQYFKDQGKTPDININNKKYGKKLSSKLISFRLNLDPKGQKNKYVIMQNGKNKFEKPIKLQSLKNNNNYLLNKSKNSNDNNPLNKDTMSSNNHDIFETINSKSKLSKNVEKLKKYSSMERLERNVKGLNHIKISNSMEAKKNLDGENTDKKKMIYKTVKIKDEYKEMDNKLSNYLFTAKQNVFPPTRLTKASLTTTKKGKTGRSNSIDNHRLIQPKKLFQNNNYILPPIRK